MAAILTIIGSSRNDLGIVAAVDGVVAAVDGVVAAVDGVVAAVDGVVAAVGGVVAAVDGVGALAWPIRRDPKMLRGFNP